MRLAEAFYRWRAMSTCPEIPWDQEIDLSDESFFYELLGLVVRGQSIASTLGPAAFQRLNEAMVADVLELEAAPPPRLQSN